MKMRIYKEKKEEELYFKLCESVQDISLCAVDENGKLLSTILSINFDGTLHLYQDIIEDIGLKLDEKGRIMIN
jgi:hypothetical protein